MVKGVLGLLGLLKFDQGESVVGATTRHHGVVNCVEVGGVVMSCAGILAVVQELTVEDFHGLGHHVIGCVGDVLGLLLVLILPWAWVVDLRNLHLINCIDLFGII